MNGATFARLRGPLGVAAALLLPAPLLALTPGKTGFSILRASPYARSAGMGEATSAYVGDTLSLHSNPAGLAHMTAPEAALLHSERLGGDAYESAAWAAPSGRGGWGMQAGVLSVDDIPQTRSDATASDRFVQTGTLQAGDQFAAVSWGRRHTRNMAVGATVKFVREVLDTEDAFSLLADAGFVYRVNYMWRTAGVVQNLGTPAKFISESFLPPARARGALYCSPEEWMEYEADLIYNLAEGTPELAVGGEFNWNRRGFFRLGYDYRFRDAKAGSAFAGASLGAGFRLGSFRADYAFLPFGDLGESQRVAVTWRFKK